MLFITSGLEEALILEKKKKKKVYPTIPCIFISSDGLVSIFNMFVMGFIRGAEREEISKS